MKKLLISSVLAVATSVSAMAQDGGTPRHGTVHKAWTLNCNQNPESGAEVCVMQQQILDNTGTPVTIAAVGRNLETNAPTLLVILPLNISLTEGVALAVDDREAIRLPVERCVQQGCRIEGRIDDDLLAWLRNGNLARIRFVIYDNRDQRRGVEVDVSLQGFTAALNDVMQ